MGSFFLALKWCENKRRSTKIRQKDFSFLFYGWSQEECGRKYTFSLSSSSQTTFHPWERRSPSQLLPYIPHTTIPVAVANLFKFVCIIKVPATTLSLLSVCLVYLLRFHSHAKNISSKLFLPLDEDDDEENCGELDIQYFFLIISYTHTFRVDITRTIKQSKQYKKKKAGQRQKA